MSMEKTAAAAIIMRKVMSTTSMEKAVAAVIIMRKVMSIMSMEKTAAAAIIIKKGIAITMSIVRIVAAVTTMPTAIIMQMKSLPVGEGKPLKLIQRRKLDRFSRHWKMNIPMVWC